MKKLLLLLAVLLIPQSAWAAIAYDNSAVSSAGTGDISFDIVPVGTVRGLIVYIITNVEGDEITSVTADGVSLSEATDSPILNTTGEDGGAHCFFLGSGIPSGTLTIAVTTSGTATTKIACAVTLTASQNTSVVDTGSVVSNSDDNPATTLVLGGVSSFCMIGFWTGLGNGSGTPFTNWTNRLSHDYGNQNAGSNTYDIIGTTDVSAGYTAGADDVAMHAIAVRENAAAAGGNTLYNGTLYSGTLQ